MNYPGLQAGGGNVGRIRALARNKFVETIPNQELLVLLLKGSSPVVFFLVPDIIPHPVYCGFTYGYNKVLVLPPELTGCQVVLIDPAGGFPFQQHQDFIHILPRPQGDQAVNVLKIPVDEVEVNSLFRSVFPDVFKDYSPDCIR